MKTKIFIFCILIWTCSCSSYPKGSVSYWEPEMIQGSMDRGKEENQHLEFSQISPQEMSFTRIELYRIYPSLFYPSYYWYTWNLRYVFPGYNSFYYVNTWNRYSIWNPYWELNWNFHYWGFRPHSFLWERDWRYTHRFNSYFTKWNYGLHRTGPRISSLNSPIYRRPGVSQGRLNNYSPRINSDRTNPINRNFSKRETRETKFPIKSNPDFQEKINKEKSMDSRNPFFENYRGYDFSKKEKPSIKPRNFNSTPRTYTPNFRGYSQKTNTPEEFRPKHIPGTSTRPTYTPAQKRTAPMSTEIQRFQTPRSFTNPKKNTRE